MRRMSSGEIRLSSSALKLQERRQPCQNGLVEDHSGDFRIETCRPHRLVVDLRSGEIPCIEVRPVEIRPGEVRPCEVLPDSMRRVKVRSGKVGPGEICVPEVHEGKIHAGEVRLAEISPVQCAEQVDVSQIPP